MRDYVIHGSIADMQSFCQLTNTEEPFKCHQCTAQQPYIVLKAAVEGLTKELTSKLPKSEELYLLQTLNQMLSKANLRPQQHILLNIVVYGIDESSPKTPRAKMIWRKFSLCFLLLILRFRVATSIRDIHRLGKFKPRESHSKPLLVKFSRNIDVNNILSNRSQIPSPVVVKLDMTKEERDIESKLLNQRWNLIQQRVDHKAIRTRNSYNQLFVDNQIHGQIINSEYVRSTLNMSDLLMRVRLLMAVLVHLM